MRRLRNSIQNDTTEKPYNNENYDIMRKTTSNKQVEDSGGVTRHSEFEKPYRLSQNENYQSMQNLHPSNYEFPYMSNSEFPFISPTIPSTIPPKEEDKCIELLKNCQLTGMFGDDCGKAMAAGCLKVIGDCMTFNWNGGVSYEEAECICSGNSQCFCSNCVAHYGSSLCDELYSKSCNENICMGIDDCDGVYMANVGDRAPITLNIPNGKCITRVNDTTRIDWLPGSETIYVHGNKSPEANCCMIHGLLYGICGGIVAVFGIEAENSYWQVNSVPFMPSTCQVYSHIYIPYGNLIMCSEYIGVCSILRTYYVLYTTSSGAEGGCSFFQNPTTCEVTTTPNGALYAGKYFATLVCL